MKNLIISAIFCSCMLSGNVLAEQSSEPRAALRPATYFRISTNTLNLANRNVSDLDLVQLLDPTYRRIMTLDLSGTRISSAGLRNLGDLANLHVLRLDRTKINDDGLSGLCALPIQELSLRGTRVSDKMINYLRLMPLKRIDVRGTRVSSMGLRRLRARHQGAVILH